MSSVQKKCRGRTIPRKGAAAFDRGPLGVTNGPTGGSAGTSALPLTSEEAERHQLLRFSAIGTFGCTSVRPPKNGPNGCAWRTEIGRSEVGRSTKVPLENRGRFPCPTFFQAIDISVLLPPSPGHQCNCEKYAITSVAYGNVVVTAGFHPGRTIRGLASSPLCLTIRRWTRCAPTSAVAAPVA